MKKFSLSLSLSLLLLIPILMPSKTYAFDVTVGATTWYAWWDGKYEQKNQTMGNFGTEPEREFNISTDPAFLYGPAISLKFSEKFNLTFVYLYGKFEQSDSNGRILGSNYFYVMTDTIYKRTDADFALNYRLNDYLKIFAGIKYMAYKAKFSGKEDAYLTTTYSLISTTKYTGYKEPRAYGPGLGLNCTLPVMDNLFILGTLSGFYLWGKEKGYLEIIEDNGGRVGFSFKDKFYYKEYGINSNLSIAYYISGLSTVISLGGRLQYFKTDCGDIKDLYKCAYFNGVIPAGDSVTYNGNKTHTIYGITLTATYTFGI